MSDESFIYVIDRLTAEFDNSLPRLAVVDVVHECRVQLCCSPAPALPELVERLARLRLQELTPELPAPLIRPLASPLVGHGVGHGV
ncbi:hypothetical protein SAMN05892883_0356 [Jatrophihabitans sp. GAS493]|uniref:hypothetical protein n=1 Tax=Jatrophihabitans sp. GAS493 TaxID=1907575 RepID=UPI000BB7FADD|nr:hypothetical protein [Jatrophihabitans sp. GAS493]SOD70697.1 hypothetical protein SAMN05892883_0356 [Jatrophihabitans sp. GAS493]